MELKVWSKTLLNIYGCLFRLSREIDKIVLGYGLKSGFFSGISKTYQDVEKIIELTDRKVTLINIKVLIQKSLLSLDDLSCKILTLRFVDKIPAETIIKVLNLKRRTYYRKYNTAINSFANKLLFSGFDANNLTKFIKDETWILDVYDDIFKKEISKNSEQDLSKYSIYSLAINDFKMKKHCGFCF